MSSLAPPGDAGARGWALSAYPVSATYHRAVEEATGGPLDVTVLSEARRRGFFNLLKTLLMTRRPRAFVLLQDAASVPLVSVLRFLASLTRCRQLALVTADGQVVTFSRLRGVAELPRMLMGSLRGAWAAAECYVELKRLARAEVVRRSLRADRVVAYFKTNLWFGVKAGGSVGHVAGVANALATRCDRVELFSVEEPPLLDSRIRFHPVEWRGAFGYPFEINYYVYQRAFVRRAHEVFRDRRPDFVYQRLSLANYSGVRLALDADVPLILEYNGSEVWVSKHWGSALKLPRLAELAEEVALRHADLIVTVSDVLSDELKARGVPVERILSHPNCVDPERFDPSRFQHGDRERLLARYGIDDTATVCGFIGTFGMWHGVTLLAEAIRELALARPEWLRAHRVHFLLVGDGLLMPQVRETLGSNAAPFVTLTGLVEQDQAPAYLAACDILLSPHVPNPDGSRFFGSPTKLFEYMAMARPIVASDLDQIGQVLRPALASDGSPTGGRTDEALAVLIRPGERDDLLRGLSLLVEHPELRDRLGRNARRQVLSRYTWTRNVEEVLQRLEAVADVDRTPPIMPVRPPAEP